MHRVRNRRASIALVAALVLFGCSITPKPGEGRLQALLRTYGTTLQATIATAGAINTAAGIACGATPPALTRSQCQSIDLAGSAVETLIHQAGDVLAKAKAGEPIDPAPIFAQLALKALELIQQAQQRSLAWK